VRGDRLEIRLKTTLGFEALAEFRLGDEVDHPRRYASGDVHTAARAEGQRNISRERSQQGAKYL
jgi:hypothetical protein